MIPDSVTLTLAVVFFLLTLVWPRITETDEEREAAEDAAHTDYEDRADAFRKGEVCA